MEKVKEIFNNFVAKVQNNLEQLGMDENEFNSLIYNFFDNTDEENL